VADLDAAAAQVDEFAVLHPVAPAARAEGRGVPARVPHGAGVEHEVPGPHGDDRRSQADLGLGERLSLGRQVPVAVGEGEAAEVNVPHPAPRGAVAGEHYQAVQARRDDGRRGGILPGHGDIGQDAARPIEIPLPGLAEGFLHVDGEIAVALEEPPPRTIAPRAAGEAHGARGRVDGGDAHPRGRPLVEGENLDVHEVRPVWIDVRLREGEAIVPLARGLGRGRQLGGDEVVAPPGQPRAETALVVDEELGKSPRPVLHGLERRLPPALGRDLPGAEGGAAAQNGALIPVAPVYDGRLLGPGVLGRERQSRGQRVEASADKHHDGRGAAGRRGFQLPHGLPRLVDARERSVGLRGIGRVEAA